MSEVENAIDMLKKCHGWDCDDEWALDLAIEALEKQTPKKPIDDSVMDEEFWSQETFERPIKTCPSCHNIYIRPE